MSIFSLVIGKQYWHLSSFRVRSKESNCGRHCWLLFSIWLSLSPFHLRGGQSLLLTFPTTLSMRSRWPDNIVQGSRIKQKYEVVLEMSSFLIKGTDEAEPLFPLLYALNKDEMSRAAGTFLWPREYQHHQPWRWQRHHQHIEPMLHASNSRFLMTWKKTVPLYLSHCKLNFVSCHQMHSW